MTTEPERFPNERPSTNSKGCLIAGAVALVLVLMAGAVVFSLYQMRGFRRTEMVHRMAEAEHFRPSEPSLATSERSIVIRQEDLAGYSATDFGESLSIENAVAILVDPSSTKLAREAFTKAADGLEVEWMLKVSEISKPKDNEILADLQIPYGVVSGNSTMSSSVSVKAVFSGDAYAELVNVRLGQWITVRGKLKIAGSNLEILDPVLALESK